MAAPALRSAPHVTGVTGLVRAAALPPGGDKAARRASSALPCRAAARPVSRGSPGPPASALRRRPVRSGRPGGPALCFRPALPGSSARPGQWALGRPGAAPVPLPVRAGAPPPCGAVPRLWGGSPCRRPGGLGQGSALKRLGPIVAAAAAAVRPCPPSSRLGPITAQCPGTSPGPRAVF